MKRYKFIIGTLLAFLISSCSEKLDTTPTDKAASDVLLSDVDKAMSTINGIYRAFYVSDWGTGWEHEQFGHVSVMHTANLMAEDMTMHEGGSGWFWYDYRYWVKGDYTNTAGRPYSSWNFYYTIITNANSILAAKDNISGAPSKINSLVGQAYALRSFAYFNLARFYQQTYVGNESAPGIPIYTEPTTIDSKGKGRGTMAEVYLQINADIDSAIYRLDLVRSAERAHISNIDYYSANGFKAQIKLEQAQWADAEAAASEALSGKSEILGKSDISGGFAFNDASNKSVLWGFEIIDDQVNSTGRASIFGHLDASISDFYANKARVCVSSWLYDQIDSTDVRKIWWHEPIPQEEEESTGTKLSYCQFKFKFSNPTTATGDYIMMRHEEMMLIQAEAMCMQDKYTEARTVINSLMSERNPSYNIDSLSLTNAKTLTTNDPNGPTTPASKSKTLLDEIILQRRIELWGDMTGRIYDVKRLKTGFTRNFAGSNHPDDLSAATLNPENPDFVMSIPQAEFDGNENMNEETDQNPW